MKTTVFLIILSLSSVIVSAQVPDEPDRRDNKQFTMNISTINQTIILTENNIPSLFESYPAGEEKSDYRKNAIFLELLGPGMFYSVNYDRRIGNNLSLRGGFTTWNLHGVLFELLGIERLSMTAFPLSINYLTGPGKSSHLEIGAGVMPSFVSGKASFTDEETGNATLLMGIGSIGYRYQKPDGGFFFRVALTPVFTQYGSAVSGGLSFGIGF
jgi:hypothetical protein